MRRWRTPPSASELMITCRALGVRSVTCPCGATEFEILFYPKENTHSEIRIMIQVKCGSWAASFGPFPRKPQPRLCMIPSPARTGRPRAGHQGMRMANAERLLQIQPFAPHFSNGLFLSTNGTITLILISPRLEDFPTCLWA